MLLGRTWDLSKQEQLHVSGDIAKQKEDNPEVSVRKSTYTAAEEYNQESVKKSIWWTARHFIASSAHTLPGKGRTNCTKGKYVL